MLHVWECSIDIWVYIYYIIYAGFSWDPMIWVIHSPVHIKHGGCRGCNHIFGTIKWIIEAAKTGHSSFSNTKERSFYNTKRRSWNAKQRSFDFGTPMHHVPNLSLLFVAFWIDLLVQGGAPQ